MASGSGSNGGGGVSDVQQLVLGWDYFGLAAEPEVEESTTAKALKNVPLKFGSVKEYLETFEPLVLEECSAQILRGQEADGATRPNRAVVVKFDTPNSFHFVRMGLDRKNTDYAENDLVLVSESSPEKVAETGASTLHALASVEQLEGEQSLRLRFSLQSTTPGADQTRLKNMQRRLETVHSAWWVLKLCNLSTISREWLALHTAPSLPFKDVILTPSGQVPAQGPTKRWQVPQSLEEQLNGSHNGSQMRALTAGKDGSPIVLVQGPPGTGKTRTILGLLSVILQSTRTTSTERSRSAVQALPAQSLAPEEKKELWGDAAPWLRGEENPRHAVDPASLEVEGGDVYGMARAVRTVRQVGEHSGRRAHVLVCAPSNMALDEIVKRVITVGLTDAAGKAYTPSVVRVGVNVHHSVSHVSMDHLVGQRISSIDNAQSQSSSAPLNAGMNRSLIRDRLRLAILDEASVVCSTLSFSGSGMFARMSRGFDVVIIDEASQAVEPSTLVPLANGCQQLFLVGDPLQLPATVLSSRATSYGYGMSMFQRLQEAGYPVEVLRTQYRMHPQIRAFPSYRFYSNQLEDSGSVVEETRRPWHQHRVFGPLAILDVPGGEEELHAGSGSYINEAEADAVLLVYEKLVELYPQLRGTEDVAVITPYRGQMKLLRAKFRESLGEAGAKNVDVNTIDGFQGREKDFAIFSTVRTRGGGRIGFVSDERRMNVGLTRARASLLVVTHATAMRDDSSWGALVEDAERRGCFFTLSSPMEESFGRLLTEETRLPGEEDPVPVYEEEWLPQAEPGHGDDEDYSDDDGGGWGGGGEAAAAAEEDGGGGGAGVAGAKRAAEEEAADPAEAPPAKRRGGRR